MISQRRNSSNAVRQRITLDDLDHRLDVPIEGWDKRVRRVIKEMRTKKLALEVPEAVALNQALEGRIGWTRLYEQQIRRLPKMDRGEEFLMARRYEFLTERLRDAVERAGVTLEDGMSLRIAAGDLPKKASAAARAQVDICLADHEALRNLYVECSLHLVFSKVNRYRNLGVDDIDLIQEANASLFQAIDGFDWRRDVRFNTYAQYWVHQAILKNLYDASRTVRLPVWIQKAHRKIQKVREGHRQSDGALPAVEIVAEKLEMTAERVEEILRVRRHAVSLDKPMFGDEDATLGQAVADEQILPIEERVQDGDLRESLDGAMSSLPERERMILQRRFGLDGAEPETLAEIADELGVTAERVRQLQNAALARLRKPEAKRQLRAFAV